MIGMVVPMALGSAIAFWLCAPLMVCAAIAMVMSKKPIHSALFLAAVMIMLAVQYAALNSPFLFVVQIIVYTGAILMLFLFVLMLVGVDTRDDLVEMLKGQRVMAGLAGLGVVALLAFAVGNAMVGKPVGLEDANAIGGDNVRSLALLIFSDHIFAFEATSALLITGALGAMMMAHHERLSPKIKQADQQRLRIEEYGAKGTHPGARPSPGVFARSNNINTPALLPDGSVATPSLSPTLATRALPVDPATVAGPTIKAFEEIEAVKKGELEA